MRKGVNGTVIDTKLILERIKEAKTFQEAKDILRQLILPERIDRTPQGYYPFSEKSQLVLRTRKFESEPILIQDMKLFRRGCINPDEGIYELDATGKIVDISLRYELNERSDRDRNPVNKLEGCVYVDKDIEQAAAIAKHTDVMTKTLTNHERVRDNIKRHIDTNLRLCWVECEKIQSPDEREQVKANIERKIHEYNAKLEDMNKKIETIKDKINGVIVDGKYYLPDEPYVTLSYILNHPETVEGTIFIIKSCKNVCGETALFHGHDDIASLKGILRIKSHDTDPHAASSRVVYREVITGEKSPRSRSKSRSRHGGKTKKNKPRNRNRHRGKPRSRITKKNKLKNKNKNKKRK